jgi:hypothetical protein
MADMALEEPVIGAAVVFLAAAISLRRFDFAAFGVSTRKRVDLMMKVGGLDKMSGKKKESGEEKRAHRRERDGGSARSYRTWRIEWILKMSAREAEMPCFE